MGHSIFLPQQEDILMVNSELPRVANVEMNACLV